MRFNSPPTALATKPFNNEEVQCCVEAVQGQRYILEVQVCIYARLTAALPSYQAWAAAGSGSVNALEAAPHIDGNGLTHCSLLFHFAPQANTSAPYGDQFDIFFRLIMLADTADASFLRVVSATAWSPNINFMMKKMVGKAVEGMRTSNHERCGRPGQAGCQNFP